MDVKMKKVGLLVLLLILALVPVNVAKADGLASSGKCGVNVTWSFKNGTLTISGTGKMYDYKQNDDGYCQFALLGDELENVVIKEGVTSIGNDTFRYCTALKVSAQ